MHDTFPKRGQNCLTDSLSNFDRFKWIYRLWTMSFGAQFWIVTINVFYPILHVLTWIFRRFWYSNNEYAIFMVIFSVRYICIQNENFMYCNQWRLMRMNMDCYSHSRVNLTCYCQTLNPKSFLLPLYHPTYAPTPSLSLHLYPFTSQV